ncbi:MAG: RNA polymerase sigma factor [Candidatus Egerieousia sp.]
MNTIFEQALTEQRDALCRYAYLLTTDNNKADDLVQETFYKALKYRNRFQSNSNLKAWLFTIMKNTFINDYRRQGRINSVIDADAHEFVVNNRKSDDNPERNFRLKEVNNMINSLDPAYKVPFLMYENGYKYQEISNELGLCLGTVKSRIHFSRKKLVKMLLL